MNKFVLLGKNEILILETEKTLIVSMVANNERPEKIIAAISERFLRDGFYKITMSEIASELRISKKTIYKHFPSKEVLVHSAIDFYLMKIKSEVEKIMNSKTNSVLKFSMLLNEIGKNHIGLSDKLLKELQLFLPGAWQKIDDFRSKMINKNITRLIDQGKKEKLILSYSSPIIFTIFFSSIRATVNPQFVINNNFSLIQSMEQTFEILMNGILTEKGKKIYKSFNKRT
jgi:AcrR family transcriptional regulator